MKLKKNNNAYHKTFNEYVAFLKQRKIYKKENRFFYENNIEKLSNWTSSDFIKTSRWFQNIRKKNKAKVKTIHLEKMKHWTYDKKGGVIKHNSGHFFKVEGKRIFDSQREVKKWDQPFMTQIGFKGGIIGLVRTNINNIPHYLVDAKFEPGNFNNIQLSPSLQATYSNINRMHLGEKNKIVKKYFTKNCKTIRKFWVTEDGGRLFKKRNLHWIIQYKGKINLPGKTFKWLTLWEINRFIKQGSLVGPHLRSILSLI